MRVGLVLDRFDRRLGGVEQWTAQLADHLLLRGIEVHVVARSIADTERRAGIVPHEVTSNKGRVEFANAVAAKLRALSLDVIHDMGVGWYYDVLQPHGGSRAAAQRQNLLMSPGWQRVGRQWAQRLLPRYQDFEALCRKQYDMSPTDRPARNIIAISRMVWNDLRQLHRISDHQMRLVYNGVNAERFTPDLREVHRARIRAELEVTNEPVYLIVAHNLELKGVPALIRAMGRLKFANFPGIVVVVGGKRLATWRQHALQAGVGSRMIFVGSVDDPTPYYAAADVYVQPTWYDPCSLVLLEALACGLPVVTTRFNGAGELIENGVHGTILSDPADEGALASAMNDWSRPGRRQMASRLCRDRALHHTFTRNVDEIVRIYDEVISSKSTRRNAA